MDYKEAWEQLKSCVENDLEQAEKDENYCIDSTPAEFFRATLDYMADLERRLTKNA